MNPQLLEYYNRELQYIREMGGEFAKEYPKIASRLALDGFECSDPYVERLLEGFAFLAARVQLKLDAGFPRFTQHLLEMVYPHYLAPLPSMAVVQMQPDLNDAGLKDGVHIPRDTQLRSQISKGEQTACEYRTAHEVTLWPLELVEASYLVNASAVANLGIPSRPGLKAGIRLRLRTTAGLQCHHLALDQLSLFLRGGEVSAQVYEQLMANVIDVVVQAGQATRPLPISIGAQAVKSSGFSEDQALLPYSPRSFQGYRLLQEYFAFPERYMFVELDGLKPALQRCEQTETEIVFLFNRSIPQLYDALDAAQFNLFCTPAINLFPKRADRVHVRHGASDFHIVPDRTRALDYEVHTVTEIQGYGSRAEPEVEFLPFYELRDRHRFDTHKAYYTIRREPRRLSTKQSRSGARSSYIGSEVNVSLVDASAAPFDKSLKQLGLQLMCTNRDLPLQMPVGVGSTDFTLQTGAPVEAVRCLAGPTRPRSSPVRRDSAWQLVSHLSLNYLSLIENSESEGPAALRQLLSLYADTSDSSVQRQVEGLVRITSRPVARRVPLPGPIHFGRGLQLTVDFDESAFEGGSVMLLGTVLEHFFTRYVSINAFTETVIRTTDRGEIKQWPARMGQRHTL